MALSDPFPSNALGVQFLDYVLAYVEDPATGNPVICRSDVLNPDSGFFYYRGLVATSMMIDAGLVTFPVLTAQMIKNRIQENNWSHIIYFEGGKIIRPYHPTLDLAVLSPTYFQNAHKIDGATEEQILETWMALP